MIQSRSAKETALLFRRCLLYSSQTMFQHFHRADSTFRIIKIIMNGKDKFLSCLQSHFPVSSIAPMSLCKILLERSHSSISIFSLRTFLSLSYEAILIIKFTRRHSDFYVSTHINLKHKQENIAAFCVCSSFLFLLVPFTSEFSASLEGSHMEVSFPPKQSRIQQILDIHWFQLQLDLYFILVLYFLKPIPQWEQIFPIISNRERKVSSRENLQSTVSKIFSKSEHQTELIFVDNMAIKL